MKLEIKKINAVKFDYLDENGTIYSANILEYAMIYYNKEKELAYLYLDFDYVDGIATFINMENQTVIYDYANHSQLKDYSKVEVEVDILADILDDIESNGVVIALDYLNKN